MANINDYLKWRGDISFDDKYDFNEIDSMILARFSYLLFDRIKMNEEETIQSISKKMKHFENDEFRYNGDKELITLLGESNRFKDLKVTDFIKNNEKENEKQFSAIVIHNNEDEMYISYIGTDASIYGWKEDFNMAFMDNVPCQIEGKEYLEKISNKYKNKKIRIGGHSKGGNVAIYAAITAEKDVKERIIKVYNYDGPGFNNEIIKKYGKDAIIKKIETYFPQESIIGRIMNHQEKCTIASSNQKGILQHDIYSWEVLGTDLIHQNKLSNSSEIINKTVAEWIEKTTVEQRKIFFDSLFEVFYSTEALTFGEMSKNMTKNLPILYKKYGEISDEDKKIITDILKLFIKSYFSEMISSSKENILSKESIKKNLKFGKKQESSN